MSLLLLIIDLTGSKKFRHKEVMNAIFKHAPWDRQQIRRTNEREVLQ